MDAQPKAGTNVIEFVDTETGETVLIEVPADLSKLGDNLAGVLDDAAEIGEQPEESDPELIDIGGEVSEGCQKVSEQLDDNNMFGS